jgi:hypothetical protein
MRSRGLGNVLPVAVAGLALSCASPMVGRDFNPDWDDYVQANRHVLDGGRTGDSPPMVWKCMEARGWRLQQPN